jgi:enediyne biosynthesis protein E4
MKRFLATTALQATAASAMLIVLCRSSMVEAFQGMATSTRSAKPANIQTNLPRIKVDFRDVAEEAGLTAANVTGGKEIKKYILETTGSGVAIFDFDNDGLMDVFIVNATTMDGKGEGEKSTSHLYHNLGNLRFEDVTAKSGLGRTGWGQGVCAGDYDNDGLRDLFVTYYGHSVLYHNEGGGIFKDVTKEAGLSSDAVRWDTGCSFVDYDLDGKLDLVLSGYVEFDRSRVPEPGASSNCQWKGMPVMCGPRGLPPGRNLLFHNNGNGKFEDRSMASGIGKPTGCYGFTVVASEFDKDGYPDLYI